ncbi:MAG: hypothetical protein HONBIEJF_00419 [Fimbriimonadaceae bacterium]|nr:hypothetical protein [Fimbriimonadaceae bacterium]
MRTVDQVNPARIQALEERLAELTLRLDKLEARSFLPEQPSLEQEETHDAPPVGAEYWIGARLLPRMGAILIILAGAYVAISETAKNASVDRALLLVIEALFCLGFIAAGEWKRDESEGFGKTLSAIGSCGLYLTAAGGHFAYHILSATGMAAVFAVLALLNHAYAVWRITRLFFFIGATGGLAAMLFPLAEKDYGTSLAVYATVTIGGAVACAMRRWLLLAFVGWLMGLAILFPVIDSAYPRYSVLAALYAGSMACVWAYARSHVAEEYDFAAVTAGVMVFVTGVVGLGVLGGAVGIVHLLVFAAVGAAIAHLLTKRNRAGRCLLIGSLACAAILVPLCLPMPASGYGFITVTALALVLGGVMGRKLAAATAVVALVVAGLAYLVASFAGTVPGETPLLLAFLFGVGFATATLKAAGVGHTSFAVAGTWLVLGRLSHVLSPATQSQLEAFSLPTIVSVVFAIALLLMGFRHKSSELRMWSIAVMVVSVFQILVLESGTAVWFRLAALLILGAIMLFGGLGYVRDRQSQSRSSDTLEP